MAENLQSAPWIPWIWGYYWLGPTQMPSIPSWIGLTDRVTGKVWWLQLAPGQQGLASDQLALEQRHLQLTDQAPGNSKTSRVFAPFDGPFVGAYGFRLGVANAHLVLDTFGASGPGPFIRQSNNNLVEAGLLMLKTGVGSGHVDTPYDHLAFTVGSAQVSIFGQPKDYSTDSFREGDSGDSDVLVP